RLVWVNVGGARPGVISMSTFGQPGRYSYCIGEHEEASPWEPLSVEHGFAAADSTVAVLAAEAPQIVVNAAGRTARDILSTVARAGMVIASPDVAPLGDTLLVIGPEHATTIAADGWSKADVRRFVWEQCQVTVEGARAPKFKEPARLHVVVAGGTAGRFSAWVPGWPFRGAPSRLVLRGEAVARMPQAAASAIRHYDATWKHRCKNGRVIDVDIVAQDLSFGGRRAALVVAHDVTSLKAAQTSLARSSKRLSVLHEIDRGMIAAEAPVAIAEAALRPLRGLLPVPRAIVNLFDLGAGRVAVP